MRQELQNLFKIAHQIGVRKKLPRIPYPSRLDTPEKCAEYKNNLSRFIAKPREFYLENNIPSIEVEELNSSTLDKNLFVDKTS